MEIKNAKFISSMADYGEFSGVGLPQIAVVGKSNVGKSSLINALCKQNKLCRTSSTPGKTRLINIFEVTLYDEQTEQKFHLIDLPGYGYAKVNYAEKIKWGEMMEHYFSTSPYLRSILHLVDIRHEPTQDDIAMSDFMRNSAIPFSVVATKADKISRGARMKHIAPICRGLKVQPWEILPFSSETKDGRMELIQLLHKNITE